MLAHLRVVHGRFHTMTAERVVATETVQPGKPNGFTLWLLQKKFACPLPGVAGRQEEGKCLAVLKWLHNRIT